MKNIKDILGLLLVSLLLIFGAFTLTHNHSDYFKRIEQAYRDHDSYNLDPKLGPGSLANLLQSHNYVSDTTDARYIATHITKQCQDGGFANLGALNRNVNKLSATDILAHGGSELHERLVDARCRLGVPDTSATTPPIAPGQPVIKVIVTHRDTLGGMKGLVNKIMRRANFPVAGVPVRLTEHIQVKRNEFDASPQPFSSRDTVLAWAVTNASGEALFPVEKGHYYSVTPVQDGYEFGREQGTVRGAISDNQTTYNFSQREQKLTPFSTPTYYRIKEDRALTVRTPTQWKDSLIVSIIMFLMAWWIGFFIIATIDRWLNRVSDHLLLIALMAMTAIGLLAMYSIADPLVDRLLGADTAWGTVFGVAALCVLSSINYVKYYNSQSAVQPKGAKFDVFSQVLRWIVLPFGKKVETLKHNPTKNKMKGLLMSVGYFAGLLLSVLLLPIEWTWKLIQWIGNKLHIPSMSLPNGIGYLLLAMVLVILLGIFGTGPEGSGARVNLGPLQPSEISKYLVVTFIAAFFAQNAKTIHDFADAQKTGWRNARLQVRKVWKVVLAIAILLMMYLGLISDMGPALVLIVTFILLYSVARRDFPQLVIGVVTFIVTMFLGSCISSSPVVLTLFAVLWMAAWIGICWITKKRVYESAIMMALLITLFMQGGNLLTALGFSEGERLANRNAVALSGVWNNDVPGGDQVAQGLWSLATGGMGGQGLGKGNPSMVPAFNTDMAFTSIGEVMGWIALALILVCLIIIIHRSLLLARRSGHPFQFFLASGIAIVTGVQFFVIVLGSVGIIPLTGVAVPLLSYGKSSLIMNLAAFGIIISCSRHQATKHQREEIKDYDNVVAASCWSFIGLSVLLLGVLFWYQDLNRDDILIRPAYVSTMQGERIAEYNPRIRLLMNHLDAGNIYDRNGLLLATSSNELLLQNITELSQHGLNATELLALSHKRLYRYYPFAEHTFFMLGDINTRTLWNNNDSDPYGYMAEQRHLSELRGFDNLTRDDEGKAMVDVVEAHSYRYNRFLPPEQQQFKFTRKDYSCLLPMLKKGANSDLVKEWNENRNKRDLTLTLDANLQRLLQEQMAQYLQNDPSFSWNRKLRASVVVLDARNGDLLTSSCYPLPDQERIAENGGKFYKDYAPDFVAFTDRDLGMTFQTQPGSTAKVMSALAGYMKLGSTASQKNYYVFEDEAVDYNHETKRPIDPTGNVNMQRAIVLSSNNFFVHLVNDQDLYHELDSIYRMAGIRIHINDGRNVSKTPYFFTLDPTFSFDGEIDVMRTQGTGKYTTYMTQGRQRKHERFNWWQTGNAWGQHNIYATPLNMARIAAIVACNGQFTPTRYILSYGTGKDQKVVERPSPIPMVGNTTDLRHYMQFESDKHRSSHPLPGSTGNDARMGGKTGTPERAGERGRRINDAWYICFIQSDRQQSPLAIAVRIERSHVGSGKAVDFVARAVIPALNAAGYQVQ